MDQHPIPQPVTSYEFRLIGDMTLKQFGKLLAGVILGLIVYAVNPPYLIKWFLILLFVGLGATSAFVPFQGRPLDVWIISFFKRIYSPTQYIWQKKETSFSPKNSLPSSNQTGVSASSPQSPSLSSTTTPSTTLSSPSRNSTSPIPPTPTLTLNIPKNSPPEKTTPPKFIPNFIVPAAPTLPNIVVGFVRTKEGKLLEDAIIEIRDEQGNPVRAFKTNKLGQFLSSTPLHNGTYEIETEKEGYQFDIIKINLAGKILPPIEIVSK